MKHAHEILTVARARGQDEQLPYSGAVSVQEAYDLLEIDSSVKLIDVRTRAERDWVGKVSIEPGQHGAVEWTLYPGGQPNPDFLTQLHEQAKPEQVLLFLCRSGARSQSAAKLATEHGFKHCFNIMHGFEGDKDQHGHRKTITGWCHAGLPWVGA